MKLAFAALSLAALAVAEYKSSDKVVILTDSNFKSEVLESSDLWFVEFYAPWCGHCKNLEPEWKKAAKQTANTVIQGTKIKFGAVDATEFSALGSKYGVQGYPTIKIFGKDKKKPKDYNGGRSASDLVNGAKNALKQLTGTSGGDDSGSGSGGSHSGGGGDSHLYGPDVKVLTSQNFEEVVVKGDKLAIVKFYAPWCGHCKNMMKDWSDAAKAMRDQPVVVAVVDATVEQDLAAQYGVKGFPSIKVFEPGKGPTEYTGSRQADDIINFLSDKVNEIGDAPSRLVQLTSPEVFEESCKTKKICVVVALPHIIDGGAARRNQYITILNDLARSNRRSGFVWYAAGEQPALDDAFGFQQYPGVVAVNWNKGRYSKHVLAFAPAQLQTFLNKIGATATLANTNPKIRTVDPWNGEDYRPQPDSDDA